MVIWSATRSVALVFFLAEGLPCEWEEAGLLWRDESRKKARAAFRAALQIPIVQNATSSVQIATASGQFRPCHALSANGMPVAFRLSELTCSEVCLFMCPIECLRTVLLLSLPFLAWFAVMGWSLCRAGEGALPRWSFFGTMAGLWGGCVALYLAASWTWTSLVR
jgi:hypothetical protein